MALITTDNLTITESPDSDGASCVYCNSGQYTELFTKNTFRIARCGHCNLVYVINPPDEKEISNIYTEEYFTGDISRLGYTNYVEEQKCNRINFQRTIANIERYAKGGKILDVGCASGEFLKLLDDSWDKYGVDISDYICRYAIESYGFNVIKGELIHFPCDKESFTVVTFLDALDHMRDPIKNLRAACELLKKGGLMVITCGDTESLFARIMGKRWYAYIPPTHLFFFSRSVLSKILTDMGLRIVKIGYPGKWVFLKLCFFRLSYIFPNIFFKYAYRLFKNNALGKLRLYYNFRDVMTVYAKKEQ